MKYEVRIEKFERAASMLLSQGSSEADVNQTERSESRPAKAGVRATGTSDDDRTSRPRFHQWQLWQAMFRIRRMLFIIATAHRVSVGTMPEDRA